MGKRDPLYKLLLNALTMLLLLFTNIALADSYVVKSVDGPVYWHNLRAGKLDQIKTGQKLAVGTLIQIDKKGKVVFDMTDDAKHEVGDIKTLEVRSPGVLRLPARIRGASPGNYTLKALPKDSAPRPEVAPIMDFRQAWQRLTAMLITPQDKSSLPKVPHEPDDLDISAASYLGKIEWQYPLGDLTLHSRRYPRSIEILWKSEAKHLGTYRVYFWPMNQSRAPAIDVIRSDRFTLTIPTEGSYFFQVTSADGLYRTSRRAVHAAAPTKNGDGVAPQRSTEMLNLKALAGEMLPPDNFVMFGDVGAVPLTLSWKFPVNPGQVEPVNYHVVFSDRKTGKKIFDHDTTATSLTFTPSYYGDFEWQIVATQGGTIQKSTFQTLSFMKSAQTPQVVSAFIANVVSRKPGTFFIQSTSTMDVEASE